MRNTKGIENAKAKVAAKYSLGSTLVTGHKGAYWEQAMEEYATSRISELEAEKERQEKHMDWLRKGLNDRDVLLEALKAENKRLREEIENQQIEIVKKDEQLDSHRWIPVTERLPESDDNVLCLTSTGNVIRFAQYRAYAGQWYYYFSNVGLAPDDRLDREITHWQPIPQPPKEQ